MIDVETARQLTFDTLELEQKSVLDDIENAIQEAAVSGRCSTNVTIPLKDFPVCMAIVSYIRGAGYRVEYEASYGFRNVLIIDITWEVLNK